MSKREHPNAKWLRALADGEELEIRRVVRGGKAWEYRWREFGPCCAEDAAELTCGTRYEFRIKRADPTWDEVAVYMQGFPPHGLQFMVGNLYMAGRTGADTRANLLRDFGIVFEMAKEEMMRDRA